jgi:hypothetical protein
MSAEFDLESLRKAATAPPDEEKKRRQHHVWRHYLKSWTVGGGLYCLRGGRIFPTGTTAIAVEKDFYKLHKLTPEDFGLIKWLIMDAAHPTLTKNHEHFLAMLTFPLQFDGRLPEIDVMIDTYRTNALEDYHAGIENSFLPLLDRLLAKDASSYAIEGECITFLHFICTQYMRTKRIKVRMIELIKEKNGRDLSRIWDIMSHMCAVNIGCGLFLERIKRKLTLVENRTDVTFVTGDQPVINLHAAPPRPPTKLSLYYPLSPRLALILPEVDEEPPFSTESLTSAQVAALNARIIEASHSQVFGDSEASLRR